MTKVILSQRDDSGYEDILGEQYQFPPKYLKAAEEALGDHCIFYEPRRGEYDTNNGRQAYWASATITAINADPSGNGLYLATLKNFLPFVHPVPFKKFDGSTWENLLSKSDGSVNKGAMGNAIRRIPDDEFSLILQAGYTDLISPLASDEIGGEYLNYGVAEEQAEFERPIVSQLTNRPFRDRVFAQQVRNAYDARCAVTGLKIINGGGRAEMEAAHIQPVASNGPDTVRNGLALSRTVHWMFDRGLISLDDDFKLLKAKGKIPDGAERLFEPSGYIHVPDDERSRPTPHFLRWHRENCFKG